MTKTLNGIQLTNITTMQADVLEWAKKISGDSLTPSPIPNTVPLARRKAMIKWAWSTIVSTKQEQGYG